MSSNTGAINPHIPGAAMEGDGFYNRHSAMQAAGNSLLLPFWEKAVRETSVDQGPLVIVDYGSSQGRNSMAPMRIAIEELRLRTGAATPIDIVHTDLPSNDFAELFGLLQDDSSNYLVGNSNVYPSAIGRSYFQPILRPGSVRLGWNSWTMHWLSGPAIYAPDHVLPTLSKSQELVALLRRRQAEDWRLFLACRSVELAAGAKLLTAFTGEMPDVKAWAWMGGELWGAVLDLGRDGLLSPDEQLQITMPTGGRSMEHIRAPFAETGSFAGLEIEHAEILKVPDTNWDSFESTGDTAAFGRSHANSVRAWAGPTIARALGTRVDKADVVNKLFARLADRLAVDPRRHEPYLAVVVLRKLH